jgi:hypothetical protein
MSDRNEEELVVEEEQLDDIEDSSEDEAPETDDREPESESENEPDEEDDRVVVLGEEPEEEQHEEAPAWVKKVRKTNRKLESEVKRLRRELEQRSSEAARPKKIDLGEKPTLKSAKYDAEKYEQQLAEYYDRKRAVEAQEAAAKAAAEAQNRQWTEKQNLYTVKKSEHGFKDFEDAEELVKNTLDVTQQSIIVQGAEDSALLVYALGKNPKKLEELAAVKSPVDFAVKLGKLESQLKVTKKKAPAPEKRAAGKTGGLGGSGDATLERLRAKAEKTGDYSEVLAYKNRSRQQS